MQKDSIILKMVLAPVVTIGESGIPRLYQGIRRSTSVSLSCRLFLVAAFPSLKYTWFDGARTLAELRFSTEFDV